MAEETVQEGGTSRYVVQQADGSGGWLDVTEVDVAPRTRRRTILERALGDEPEAGTYRVLDAESAAPMEVSLEEQPPRLVIS